MTNLVERAWAVLSRKWVRYVVVGTGSLGISFAVFYLCYKVFGVQYAIATVIGNVVAWAFNFPLHKWWTFGDRGRTKKATSLQTILHLSLKFWNNFVAAPLLVIFFVEYVGMLPTHANPIAGILLGFVQNYPINRFIIFRRPPE